MRADTARAHLPTTAEGFFQSTSPPALASLHFYSPSVEALDAFSHPTVPLLPVFARPMPRSRDADRVLSDRDAAGTMEATTLSRASGRAPRFAIAPATPPTNAQGKGCAPTHGEKPQGQEGSSWGPAKPPVPPDLSLCSTLMETNKNQRQQKRRFWFSL